MRVTDAAAYRVMVVANDAMVAMTLSRLLAGDPQFGVVGSTADATHHDVGRLQPDLIVIDMDGFALRFGETVRICRAAAPKVRIIAVTAHAEQQSMQRSLASGVDGYLVKDLVPAELMRACRAVARGESYVDARAAGELLRRLQRGSRAENALSPREADIIRLIADGLANKEIGERLQLSEKTVKNHVRRIFAKLRITARTQAAVYAIRNGIA